MDRGAVNLRNLHTFAAKMKHDQDIIGRDGLRSHHRPDFATITLTKSLPPATFSLKRQRRAAPLAMLAIRVLFVEVR